ncbi:PaaI family thioesterase [Qipengyuania qiaonensis]|uniref:Medium/long-chain acyl-CoA thioesterase YigI n=1 Tax=Qipengyuania qiaonensis TaxID=2867240 RepID=A0ABS7JEL8_9SPHN|nr:PaaI family thioesterase [Qipengyuania qiaonensis]MBX7484123.1 PaaI family thioesterase [Qipengyuania qiaonensis]
MKADSDPVPPGFERHFRKSPVTDPWEPLFVRQDGGTFSLGLRIAAAHSNARGLLHGGVISALADNAMGLACVMQMERSSALTVSLSVDFLSIGRIGQWLEVRAVPAKLGRTLAFADARIEADREMIAKAAATFRIVEVASKAT